MNVIRTSIIILAVGVASACGGKLDDNGNGSSSIPTDAESNHSDSGNASTPGSTTAGETSVPCALPACEVDDVEFRTKADACVEVDGVTCYDRTACGRPLWCRHYDEDDCAGAISCAPGWKEVAVCTDDRPCTAQTACGRTIQCQEVDADCDDDVPECADDKVMIRGSYQCPYDKTCTTRSNACGFTIWCKPLW